MKELEEYFALLVEGYSWSTVKLDRLGLMFFWKHVLERVHPILMANCSRCTSCSAQQGKAAPIYDSKPLNPITIGCTLLETDWQWLNIVKAPVVKTIPDILTREEIGRIIHGCRELRYRVFLFTTYSMGLRLEEALSLQVGDIDTGHMKVHIRRGKGHKDRLVPLPNRTLEALRLLWREHQHPKLLFPNYRGSMETIRQATNHMNNGGAQQAMKAVVTSCGIKKKSRSTAFATASLPTCSSPA